MDLSWTRPGLLAGLLLLPSLVAAEEQIPAPDPHRLDADWWTYLAPAESLSKDDFNNRSKLLDEALLSLDRKLEPSVRALLGERIGTIRARLQAYVDARGAAPAELPTISPPATEYTLSTALQRFEQRRGLEREIAAIGEELAWQQELLAAKRRQFSRLKVRYLELASADPDRLELGLGIMQDRMEIETTALSLQRRETRLQRLRDNARDLADELVEIPARLTAEKAESDRWRSRQDAARKAAGELRTRIESGSKSGTTTITDSDNQLARVEVLRGIDLDAEATRQELIELQSGFALALVRLIEAGELPSREVKALRERLSELLKEIERKRKYWERASERARDLSAVSGGEGDSASTTTIRKKLLQRVESINLNLLKLDQQREATVFFDRLLGDRIRLSQGLARQWLEQSGEFVLNAWRASAGLLSATLFEVNETPVTSLGLIRVVVILAISWLLSTGIRRALARLAQNRSNVSQSSLYTLSRVVHYFVLGVGIIIGLSSIGIDFTKFALLVSALGIGIGFGLQTLVSNFVAGLIILFEKSLKVGDFVELASGLTGEVREINMRSTLITTNDNVDILVPNSEFMNNQVTNWTLREAFRRIRIPFGVAYGTQKELVEKAVLEAANNVQWTLHSNIKRRKPQVWFVGFGDSSLNFELVVWLTPEAVKRPGSVNAEFLWEIDNKLREYEIEVPFPQRDLNLRSLFGARDVEGLDLLRGLIERHRAAEQGKPDSAVNSGHS